VLSTENIFVIYFSSLTKEQSVVNYKNNTCSYEYFCIRKKDFEQKIFFRGIINHSNSINNCYKI